MGRCVQGHDYTKEEFLAYPDKEDFDAVFGIQENVKPEDMENLLEKRAWEKRLLEKKAWKKRLENGVAQLRATLTNTFTLDHQVPEGELDALLHWLCRVAKAMFQCFDCKLGNDKDAWEEWKKAICQAADPDGRYGNRLDVLWPEIDGPEEWVDLT